MSKPKEELKGESGPSVEVLYAMSTNDISHLEGMMLTLVDAAIGDMEQRKALKDLVRQNVWNWAFNAPRRVEEKYARFTFVPTNSLLAQA